MRFGSSPVTGIPSQHPASHLLTRERSFSGCEELSWAGFGWQGIMVKGRSISRGLRGAAPEIVGWENTEDQRILN
jgi:hypothetical protein